MASLNCPSPPVAGIQGTPRLAVARLVLTDFRCYGHLRMALDARPVVLFGPNGAGKTNLLEAVSFLAPGQGLRRARLADVDRKGGGGAWAVAATMEGPHGAVRIGTGRDPRGGGPGLGTAGRGTADMGTQGDAPSTPSTPNAAGSGRPAARRLVRIDGNPARGPAALAEVVRAVWLTPDMDRLFDDGPSKRRRFLDRVVYGFDPGHAARLSAYERALRDRARLLRMGPADPVWLGVLEERMAAEGIAVAAARRDVVARLSAACAGDQGPFPAVHMALAGTVEDWLAQMPALEAEERLAARLAAARDRDAVVGGAADGPHKSDLRVRHVVKDMPAEQCSTGEQKALVIAVVLASAALQAQETGAAPLILLDEVVAHLDAQRRAALLERICELGAQAWLTGTDAAVFAQLGGRAQFFRVADATLTPADRF